MAQSRVLWVMGMLKHKAMLVAGFEPLLLCETKESIADGSLVSIQGYRQL